MLTSRSAASSRTSTSRCSCQDTRFNNFWNDFLGLAETNDWTPRALFDGMKTGGSHQTMSLYKYND